ncbi:hypothetical protein M413DRAFT_420247 [Hebeloma cylindrosporum]|uniref:Uncharacterized protein n=1 Tax=Hebeloma cylindrosporum TaxID=76867 RepID=A0A0C3C4E4_HEBCY|nr:hypothetical protein M413DRAFT_420247 [Hebeloma cylindrosporum h7]
MEGMYENYNPVAWKCVNSACADKTLTLIRKFCVFGQSRHFPRRSLALTKPQVDFDILQSASYSTHIKVQEQTTLTMPDRNPPVTYKFSKPEPWTGAQPNQFLFHNETEDYQDIGVGFYEPGHQDPVTTIVILDIPRDASVPIEFTPILTAYVASGYKQTEIITTQVQNPLDWEKNLMLPSLHRNWKLEESGEGYKLVEDDLEHSGGRRSVRL